MNLQNLAANLRQMQQPTDIKLARGMAHLTFDRLWKSGCMSRSKAYAWLANEMGLSRNDAHIAKFNYEQCQQVEKAARDFMPHLYR
jgi:hypothetical protein